MPAAIPLIAAGVGVAGSAIASAQGVGKNTFRAGTYERTGSYDANRFNYGGAPGGAGAAAERYRLQGEGAQGRGGLSADYGLANFDRQQQMAARVQQQQAADLMMARAQGLVPSIAQMQADRQMQQANAAQASAAASARGPAGIALAQQNAANNVATMQSAISNQAQINAAQERMAAEQAAFGAYAGLRGTDLASQQQVAQQAQYNAGLGMQQRQLNDAYSLGMAQQEHAVRQGQLGADISQQQMLSGSYGQANQLNSGVNAQNAQREMGFFQAGLGAVEGAAGMASAPGAGGAAAPAAPKSDDRAKHNMSYLSDDRAKLDAVFEMGLAAGARGQVPLAEQAQSLPRDFVAPSGPSALPMPANPVDRKKRISADFAGSQRRDREDRGAPARGVVPPAGRRMVSFERGDPAEVARQGRSVEAAATDDLFRHATGIVRYDTPYIAKDEFSYGKGPDGKPVMLPPGSEGQKPVESNPIRYYLGNVPNVSSDDRAKVIHTDPVTRQFAEGLAPIRYEYKPGMGDGPGPRTGVRAQGMLGQPLTASAIEQRPDGLLAINMGRGMSTALAAAGHNSRKLAEHDEMLQRLMARKSR